jgi:hypothetical protein
MFYHVELTATDTNGTAFPMYDYILTADEVEQCYAAPYTAGGTVTIGKRTFGRHYIKRLRIVRTDRTLTEW